MPKLERRPQSSRHAFQEVGQQRCVFLKVRWQLEKDWPQLRFEVGDDLAEVLHRVAAVLEPCEMRHLLRRFQAELETFWRARIPILDRLRARNPAEAVVHFRRRESLRV